jgi:hypothetical protein
MENATQFVHGTPREAASQRTWTTSVLVPCTTWIVHASVPYENGMSMALFESVLWMVDRATTGIPSWLPRYSACRHHKGSLTSHARLARCLFKKSENHSGIHVKIDYLRKLGWPGVCELGAGVPLGPPGPFAEAMSSVAALIVAQSVL